MFPLIISRPLTITGAVIVLWCPIFLISISRYLYLLSLLYSLIDMLSSVDRNISIRSYSFLLESLTTISERLLNFSVNLDYKVPENNIFFGFCNYFWLVFIPFSDFRILLQLHIFQWIYHLTSLYIWSVLRLDNRTLIIQFSLVFCPHSLHYYYIIILLLASFHTIPYLPSRLGL